MLTTHTIAEPDSNVVSTTFQSGETVLLHIGLSIYFTLNETGSRIWNLMSEGSTLGEVSQTLGSEFDVTSERAKQCAIDLTNELVQEKLAHVVQA